MELAEHTGIPRRYIFEMENGKRPIGKQNAGKPAEVLDIDPRRLLAVSSGMRGAGVNEDII